MRIYQEKWLKKLRNYKTDNDLYRICQKISSDDSGCTDELTQLLAIILLVKTKKAKP